MMVEGSVGGVVEVGDDEAVELLSVPDEGAVEEFAAQGPDPAFCEGVGRRGRAFAMAGSSARSS